MGRLDRLVSICEEKLNYWDIVDEHKEDIDYRTIIGVVIEQIAIDYLGEEWLKERFKEND